MLDILLESLIDTLKNIPFLFIAFYLIEIIEHKININNLIKKSGKLGPLIGGILGFIPQCGISTLATNLYITRIISLGTLISVYLSTSDETIPILISTKASFKLIISIILIKIIIGVICGFLIDLMYHKNNKNNYSLCKEEKCHCDESIFKSSLVHTLKVSLFILIVNIVFNFIFYIGLEEYINKILLDSKILSPFIICIIGMIPNCASSVILTKLYLSNNILFGSLIGGLLTNSGLGLLLLYKYNKNIKENIFITLLLYIVGVIFAILLNFIL